MKLFHPKVSLVFLKYLIATLAILFTGLIAAQTVSINAEGNRIIQFDDGTWRYFEGKDSALLRPVPLEEFLSTKNVTTSEPQAKDTIIYDYRLFTKYVAAAVKYESLMLDKVDESSEKVFSIEEKINSLESENKEEEAAALKGELKLLTKRKQDDQRLLSYARSLIKKILKVGKKEDYVKLQKIYVPGLIPEKEISTEDSLKVTEKLEDLEPTIVQVGGKRKDDPSMDSHKDGSAVVAQAESESEQQEKPEIESTLASLPKDQNRSDKERKKNRKNRAQDNLPESDQADLVSKEATGQELDNNPDSSVSDVVSHPEELSMPDSLEDLVSPDLTTVDTQDPAPAENREEEKSDTSQLLGKDNDTISLGSAGKELVTMSETTDTDDVLQETNSPGSKTLYLGSPKNRWFSSEESTLPAYRCDFEFQGVDEFTNQPKKELRDELFFTHTDERLKPYLKNRDYVTCNGYLTSIAGGFRYLTLIVKIASRNAVREYGNIRNGSLLNLKLLDEQTVSLFSQSESQGLQDPKTGDTVYKIRYPIDYQKEKMLLRTGVDKVRIVWSSGYEDYEVYNVDFFINQLNCLNSK